jgi:hypothetical protein
VPLILSLIHRSLPCAKGYKAESLIHATVVPIVQGERRKAKMEENNGKKKYRTPQGTVDLLNRIGFTYKQTKQVPCEVDVQAQEDFMEVFSDILEQTTRIKPVFFHPTPPSGSF